MKSTKTTKNKISTARKERKDRRKRAAGVITTPYEVELHSEMIRRAMREDALKRKASNRRLSATPVLSLEQRLERMHPSMRRSYREALAHRENPERAGKPFKVMRIENVPNAVTSAAGGVGYAKNFQLDQIPQFADFVNLFDQYRFTHVTALFIPRTNTNNLTVASNASTQTVSPILAAFDPDDSTTPTSDTDVLSYPTCKVFPGYKVWKYHFKPRAAIAAYGGAFSQFADFDQWCDCASDDVEWYALKVWQEGDGASQTTHQIWDAYFFVEMEFRFVH